MKKQDCKFCGGSKSVIFFIGGIMLDLNDRKYYQRGFVKCEECKQKGRIVKEYVKNIADRSKEQVIKEQAWANWNA